MACRYPRFPFDDTPVTTPVRSVSRSLNTKGNQMTRKQNMDQKISDSDLGLYTSFLGAQRMLSREDMIASLQMAAGDQPSGLLTMEAYEESKHAVCKAETTRRRFKTWRNAQCAAQIIQTNVPVRELKPKRLAEHLDRALVHGHRHGIADAQEALRSYAHESKLYLGKKHYEAVWGSLPRAVRALVNLKRGVLSEADYLCGAADTEDKRGYIYVERHGSMFAESTDLNIYRIGSTKNPDGRISVSRSQSPTKIDRVALRLVNFPRKVERYLHRRLKDRNVKGSHYLLTKNDIEYINTGPIEADAAKQ